MNIAVQKLSEKKELTIFLIIVVLSVVVGISNPNFFTIENALDLLKNNTVLGIMAMGMLLVILTGGIDVSVGAIIAAVTVVTGNFLIYVSSSIFLAFIVGCLTGVLLGSINGLLISRLNIPPIVVTLGTMSIINGMVLYLTNGKWINNIPTNFIQFGRISFFDMPTPTGGVVGFPVQGLFVIGAIVLVFLMLQFTIFGRGIFAVGDNLNSAQRLGYNSKRITLFVYVFEGFLIGLAGVVHTTIFRQVDPNAFNGYELQVIAAVVLGGASIIGGQGSVGGTVLGVILFAIINNGLILMRIPTFWQKIVMGIVIIVSVGISVVRIKIKDKNTAHIDVAADMEVGA